MELVPFLVLLAAFVMALGVFSRHRERDRAMRFRLEMQNRMLDRLTTNPELLQYLNTPDGKKLLEAATTDPVNPKARVVQGIQIGVVILILSGTIFGVRPFVDEGKAQDLMVAGTAVGGVAIAFLVGAAVSYYLTQAFGLDKR